jgi:uncharacterized protein (DUF58 family)
MNRRAIILIILIYSLILSGLAFHQRALLIYAIPLVIYLVSGIFFEPRESHLQVERKLSADRVSQGSLVTVDIKITNPGVSLESLIIEDIIPSGLEIIDGSPRKICSLKSAESISYSYTLRGERGLYHLPGIQLTLSDHLGLLTKQQAMTISNRIMIVPDTHHLPGIAVRPRRTRVYPGLIPANKGGPGVEFYGVREYHPGDPRRWINHRLSARHEQTLFINEFEQERAVDIGLILDCRVETNLFQGNRDFLEYGTQAAATMAETFLNDGNRVGLLIYGGGRNWVHPGYGKIQRERILQALARVTLWDYAVAKELSNLPTQLFPPRTQLVLISSLLFDDLPTLISLRAHGYPLLVISPNPVDFEYKLLGDSQAVAQAARIARLEREFMLRQIQNTGARVVEWQVDQPFHLIANHALISNIAWYRNEVAVYA